MAGCRLSIESVSTGSELFGRFMRQVREELPKLRRIERFGEAEAKPNLAKALSIWIDAPA